MFPTTQYIQSSFNVTFPRATTIRRLANKFEDTLVGKYSIPQVLAIPDDFDPELPRVIFESDHGYSQIVITQINVSLNVKYSPDWQTNIELGKQYLLERTKLLFTLLEIIEVQPYFCGFLNITRLATEDNDQTIINHIASKLLRETNVSSDTEILIRRSTVTDNKFFSHIAINNYRTWKVENKATSIPRFPYQQAVERGIEITGDFNDRFAYNETESYRSNEAIAPSLINQGIEAIQEFVKFIKE